jgi:hypothetical protein
MATPVITNDATIENNAFIFPFFIVEKYFKHNNQLLYQAFKDLAIILLYSSKVFEKLRKKNSGEKTPRYYTKRALQMQSPFYP